MKNPNEMQGKMSSQHWDEARADAYARFRYDFPERTLAGKKVVVAGGTGGLGAATVSLLLREGAHLIVGYRKDRERAADLSKAMGEQYGANLELIEGDIASSEVRGKYIEACQRAGATFAGVAIFPGDPARVAFDKLDRDALVGFTGSELCGPGATCEGPRASDGGGQCGRQRGAADYDAGACGVSGEPELWRAQGSALARGEDSCATVESCAGECGRSWRHDFGNGSGERAIGEVRSLR